MPTIQSGGRGMGNLGSLIQGQPEAEYRRPSATDQLKGKKARLEADLAKVNAALEAFDKNPDMQLAIDAVFEAL
jgi:ribosome-associated translation inhibitor RaiA